MTGDVQTGRAPTIDQVAARAGVGRGTVSRVVNGSPKVTDATRTAVLQAIDDLGYVPNRAARALVTRATDTIALVVSESQERVFGNPYFGQVVRGVSAALAPTGRQLMVTMHGLAGQNPRLERYLTQAHVDGVLLLAIHGDDPLPEKIAASGVPAVLGGRLTRTTPLPFVDADNAGGARAMVEHLIASGRRTIATVAGPSDMAAGVHRLDGYRAALRGAGLPIDESLVVFGDFGESSGHAAGLQMLDRAPGLDAIFCASDAMAAGVLTAVRQSGRCVPDDVAVAGFDDSPIAPHTSPTLTTVHQPVERMGAEMVRLLTALIDGQPVESVRPVVLPTRLVIRTSA